MHVFGLQVESENVSHGSFPTHRKERPGRVGSSQLGPCLDGCDAE